MKVRISDKYKKNVIDRKKLISKSLYFTFNTYFNFVISKVRYFFEQLQCCEKFVFT